MAAQIVHAAGESVSEEIPPGTNAVVLQVKDQTDLILTARKLQKAGIPHVLVQEVDPPYSGQSTAIGITPLSDRKRVRKIIGKLTLLGQRDANPSVVESQPSTTAPVVK